MDYQHSASLLPSVRTPTELVSCFEPLIRFIKSKVLTQNDFMDS